MGRPYYPPPPHQRGEKTFFRKNDYMFLILIPNRCCVIIFTTILTFNHYIELFTPFLPLIKPPGPRPTAIPEQGQVKLYRKQLVSAFQKVSLQSKPPNKCNGQKCAILPIFGCFGGAFNSPYRQKEFFL